MKDYPILFSTPMVQAILEGRKTQTRRIVKGMALEWLQPGMFAQEYVAAKENGLSPYGYEGDNLWVRETFQRTFNVNSTDTGEQYLYKANPGDEEMLILQDTPKGINKWKPSIHMPKKACRLWLKVKSVRIERLHDISEEDAIAEGIEKYQDTSAYKSYWSDEPENPKLYEMYPVRSFYTLWQSINANRNNGLYAWDENPWVWVIEFEKLIK